MKALILAAGEGVRLRPYTLDRPKCMVEIGGKSLLERQLAVMETEGIDPVILIGGYRSEMLHRFEVPVRVNPRYFETNMLWTLFCAEPDLEGELIVSYGDIVYSRENLRALKESAADIAVVIDLDWESYWRSRNEDPLADAETLKLSQDGQILEIGKKPKTFQDIEGQYMGLMKFSATGVKALKEFFHAAKATGMLQGKPLEKAYMTDLLQAMIEAGYVVSSVCVHGKWVEIDTVADLLSDVSSSRLKEISL